MKKIAIFAVSLLALGSALCGSYAATSNLGGRAGQASYDAHRDEFVTAARHEPIGSVLQVTNPQNGRTITVRVNDRGPFNGNRILDLSTGAFRALYGGLGRGVGPVRYVVVSRGGSPRWSHRGGGGGNSGRHNGWHHHHHHHHHHR